MSSNYPDSPGYKRTGPSQQGAKAVAGMASKLRTRVLEEFKRRAFNGATADEIADALDCSILSVRPRVSELHHAGEIIQTGMRRENGSGLSATVWIISPPMPANYGRPNEGGKLGRLEDISHNLRGVENATYGSVAFIMERPFAP